MRVFVLQDTDLVPSDIAAGLALLHQEQDKMEQSRDPEVVVDHSPSSPIVSAGACCHAEPIDLRAGRIIGKPMPKITNLQHTVELTLTLVIP